MIRGPVRFAAYGLGSLLVACAAVEPWNQTPRPATGLPDHFTPDSSFTMEARSDSLCLVHLIDPRGEPRLLLVRSTTHQVSHGPSAVGDYKVQPPGGYGIGEKELLRVECRSGRPDGIVTE
jgi:hypothetical protein